MNDSLRKNLERARIELRIAQDLIAIGRCLGGESDSARTSFYRALDRLWEAQCMAGGSL